MASEKDLDALAERIRTGIAKNGCQILDSKDIEILWAHENIATDDEKRLIVKNFAAYYGFTVDIGPGMVIAAFQNRL